MSYLQHFQGKSRAKEVEPYISQRSHKAHHSKPVSTSCLPNITVKSCQIHWASENLNFALHRVYTILKKDKVVIVGI